MRCIVLARLGVWRRVLPWILLLGLTAAASAAPRSPVMPSLDLRPAVRPLAQRLAGDPHLLALLPDVTIQPNSAEAALLADAADGRLDEHSLLEAALVASGVEDAAARMRHVQRVSALALRLRQRCAAEPSPQRQAQLVLETLHEELLAGQYALPCTQLHKVLQCGDYNCVSATLLYNCLCQVCGLDARACEMPGHAFSVVVLPDGTRLEVETTCRQWFRLSPEAQRTAGAAGINPRDAAPRRNLAPVQLVAIIYYNRGVDALEQSNFPAAVRFNAYALRLDPTNQAAEGNLLAAVNNWALEESSGEDFARAVALLGAGLRIAPWHRTFEVNYLAVHQQWIEHLTQQGQLEALAELARRTLHDPALAKLPVLRSQIRRLAQQRLESPAALPAVETF